MQRRRLEDRIQDLATRAVATQDAAELDDVIRQLRVALHQHSDRLRKMAADKLTKIPRTTHVPTAVRVNTAARQAGSGRGTLA